MMRKKRLGLLSPLLFALCLTGGLVQASGGDEVKLEQAPIDRFDRASVQRGARLFSNYCLSCHQAKFMNYSSLRELGLTDAQIQQNFLSKGQKVTQAMKSNIEVADAKNWFGSMPPDLTLAARSRGTDWIYSYLRGFYKDPSRPTGWNNIVFPNVGMPHVLWERSSQGVLAVQKFESLGEAQGEALQTNGPTKIKAEHGHGGGPTHYILEKVNMPQSTPQIAENYNRDVTDLVNYMAFMAEPGYLAHRQTGRFIVIALAFAVFAAYIVKREYWKDIR
ncbi:MAG: cytochrome c1 [Pseudomonadota bacterium]